MNIFSLLKHQNHYFGSFIENQLSYGNIVDVIKSDKAYGTWDPVLDLEVYGNVKYACLLTKKSIAEDCQEHIQKSWETINKSLKAFIRSYYEIKPDPAKWSVFEFVPENILNEYCQIKNELTSQRFQVPEPQNYEALKRSWFLVEDIASRPLKVWGNHSSNHIHYDIMKSRTGRLTTKKDSFPILTLKKQKRAFIRPNNDLFVSLDYNGFDLRTFLFLAGHEQPQEDIHEWNIKHIFKGFSREQSKKALFSWLYDDKDNLTASQIYEKQPVLEKHYDPSSQTVKTALGRAIESVDKSKALSYIVQSTASDLFIDRCCEIREFLRAHQTKIAILLHDEVVLDFKKEEIDLLKPTMDIFQNTKLGKLPINVTIFKDNFLDAGKHRYIAG